MAVPPSLQPPSAYFSAAERSQRSVFVGNIPYEATEDELKTIFSQAGPVVNFRLVFDRETGKPKGYGFCEYADQETAMSAMRNLNNVEFHGRTLRVDTATGDRNKEEIRQLQMTLGGPQEESPYGPPVEQDKAPEAISRAVASLPPEQMFELMKQMKLCIQNNPNEARNMLLQNPQLAYALLQAQVVMRIVDPQVALAMLHRDTMPIMVPPSVPPAVPVGMGSMGLPFPPIPGGPILPPPPVSVNPQSSAVSGIPVPASAGQPLPGAFPSVAPTRPPTGGGLPPLTSTGDVDYRQGIKLPPATSAAASASKPADAEESEKVLQLTDEQIALLPPDQRHSVLVLKEQLKGTSPAI